MRDHAGMDTVTTENQAEYGRFADLEHRFGIKRSMAYELIGKGQIKSAVVRRKGARCGIRLIDLASVRDFLRANTQ